MLDFTMKTPHVHQLRKRLTLLAARQEELLRRLRNAVAHSADSLAADIDRIHRDLSRLSAQQLRTVSELKLLELSGTNHLGGAGTRAGDRPLREQVLDVLEEIGVPTSPRLLSEFAVARFLVPIPPERLASLRRDEERAFRKDPLSRPAWVVPALNATSLSAIPRLLSSSSWEVARRVIAARTLRVNHLRALLAFVQSYLKVPQETAAHARLQTLILRVGETVPGAVQPTRAFDVRAIQEAAERELNEIEPGDMEERQAAAARLAEADTYWQAWGRPQAIDGGQTLVERRV